VPWLGGHGGDRAAARDALVRRQRCALLDGVYQEVKGVLSVRLDQLELREGVFISLDVIAVLHLVETVCRVTMSLAIRLIAVLEGSSSNGTRIGPGVKVDRVARPSFRPP
jgi:hypothetical protein